MILNGKKVNEFVGDQPVPPRKEWFEPVRGPRPDSGYIGAAESQPAGHGVFSRSEREEMKKTRMGAHHCTAMVTPDGLLDVPIVRRTGTASPDATPAGTRAFT